jgi:TonB family protein
MEKIAIAAYIWCLAFASASFAQVPDGERMSPELSRRIQNIDAAAQMERGEVVRPSDGELIINRVKPNIVFNPDDVSGNPVAEVEVRTAPDGKIMVRKLIKSSGNSAWDEAVIKAIDKTDILPLDTTGKIPSILVLAFGAREGWFKVSEPTQPSLNTDQKPLSEINSQKCLPLTYPVMSKRIGEQGVVIVRSKIGVDGKAINPEILNSSGYERLDRAAIKWVNGCSFKSIISEDKPTEGYYKIPIQFKLVGTINVSESYSIKNNQIISENITEKLNVRYSSDFGVIMVGCRLGKNPMVTSQTSTTFQQYLSKAFNDELKNAGKFDNSGKEIKIGLTSVELSTLGKNLWVVELLVYLDESNKVIVKTIMPFIPPVPSNGPCENAFFVLPELASEIIKSVFSDKKVLSIVN